MQNRHGTRIPDKNIILAQITLNRPKNLVPASRCNLAVTFMSRIPKKVADPSLDLDTWEHITGRWIVHQFAHVTVTEHRFAELIHASSARQPPRWDNHAQEARV